MASHVVSVYPVCVMAGGYRPELDQEYPSQDQQMVTWWVAPKNVEHPGWPPWRSTATVTATATGKRSPCGEMLRGKLRHPMGGPWSHGDWPGSIMVHWFSMV